jgi:hypothetical protein
LVREVIEYEKAAAPAHNVNLLSVQQVGGGVTTIKAALSTAAEDHTGLANLCIEEVPDGADVVKSQTTYNYFSELELAGSLNIDTYIDDTGSLEEFDTIAGELDSTVVVEYETDTTSGISKTITKRSISRSQTVSGQQDLATRAQDLDTADLSNSIASLLNLARRQVYIGADTSLHTQREYGLQKRPSESDRNNTANTKPVITEQKAEIAWVVGSTTSTAVTEFTVPYAPDDEITWNEGTGTFSSIPSDAKEKALRYGRIQNKLLLGNRSGVSLQLAPEQLPKRPFDPLYLQASGITGSYRVNGTSWAFDANGIVASTDALLWGAVSATSGTDLASSWVPLAPGTTSLPLPYTPTSGELDSETGVTYSAVITPTTVLPPYNESVLLDGVSRSTAVVSDYPYTLDRGSTAVNLITKTGLTSGYELSAETGSFVLTGQDATLSGGATPADPYLRVLLHYEGTVGDYEQVYDSSPNALIFEGWNWEISDAQVKFGTTAWDSTYGSSSSIAGVQLSPGVAATAIAADEDFTIEFWAYHTYTSATLSASYLTSIFETRGTNRLVLTVGNNQLALSDNTTLQVTHQDSLQLNTWVHVAVVRESNVVSLFYNGIKSTTTWATSVGFDSSTYFRVGQGRLGYNKLYYDEFRLSVGIARYSADFTPPTEAFPD